MAVICIDDATPMAINLTFNVMRLRRVVKCRGSRLWNIAGLAVFDGNMPVASDVNDTWAGILAVKAGFSD